MSQKENLDDDVLDDVQGAISSDPEWRYVPVRRFSAVASGAFTLPEVEDEVLVAGVTGDRT